MKRTRSTGVAPAVLFNENAKSMFVDVRIASINTLPPFALLNASDVAAANNRTVVPAVVSRFIARTASNIPPAEVFIRCLVPSAILACDEVYVVLTVPPSITSLVLGLAVPIPKLVPSKVKLASPLIVPPPLAVNTRLSAALVMALVIFDADAAVNTDIDDVCEFFTNDEVALFNELV